METFMTYADEPATYIPFATGCGEMRSQLYPFTAVVGQEDAKACLLYSLVNPRVGGVLISGERGSGKTTLVRGLADLVEDMRIVELPLGATEDRLLGSLDVHTAITRGEKRFEPGLLQSADGNILYVDEINLLAAHMANTLLEAASGGVARIEREGLSGVYDSRFILIGTMNPLEGTLRAQLLDRFGLCVIVSGDGENDERSEAEDLKRRVEIILRRMEFERDPAAFRASFASATETLARRVAEARRILPEVRADDVMVQTAAAVAASVNCAGHRAEIALIEAARACAALSGRRKISLNDLKAVSAFALVHRARPEAGNAQPDGESAPEESKQTDENRAIIRRTPRLPEAQSADGEFEENSVIEDDQDVGSADSASSYGGSGGNAGNGLAADVPRVYPPGEIFEIKKWKDPGLLRKAQGTSGRRFRSLSANRTGRYISSRPRRDRNETDIAIDATIRTAAVHQRNREHNGLALAIEPPDIRIKVREASSGSCILFAVDASASIGAHKRMYDVKAAAFSMLGVSYQKRDSIGLVSFRKGRAELVLDITRSVHLAQKRLRELPCGGNTPLAAGIDLARRTLVTHRLKYPDMPSTMVLITDGRATCSDIPGTDPFEAALRAADRFARSGFGSIILDTENGRVRFHMCAALNELLGGTLLNLDDLESDGIAAAINEHKLRR